MIRTGFKVGDTEVHGIGTISTISPDGMYCTVRWQTDKDSRGYYIRTHRISSLKLV